MKTTRERDKIANKIVEEIYNDLCNKSDLFINEPELEEEWDIEDISETKARWLSIVKRYLVISPNPKNIAQ